jgi:lambda repressor-like predicted transcriptional regulator
MTRREIQTALKERGITQASIAREAGVSTGCVANFLRRKFRSARLAKLLDEKLGTVGAIK